MDKGDIPIKVYIQLKIIVREALKEAFEKYNNLSFDEQNLNYEDFLSATQAAKYLKMSINTLYAKVEKGILPFYRSGKRKLIFSKKELIDYIKSKKISN